MSDYDDTEFRAQQAEKARKMKAAADRESDARLRAIVRADRENQRSNPALQDAYVPHVFTEAEEAELVTNIYGTEAQRIARMMGETGPQN